MSTLGRRLDSLGALAEEARRREFRDRIAPIVARRGVALEAVLNRFERLRGEAARLRTAGLSDDEIVARSAARMGLSPDELRRRADVLADELAG